MKNNRELSILEAIVTSETADGKMHVAPMGPEVDATFEKWRLKPFQSSTTFANLRRSNRCIVHVVDDALLLAQAVLGQAHDSPAEFHADAGFVLNAATHWYALSVDDWNVLEPRAVADCRVVRQLTRRPFFGWNRAKHAIVELAIVASRVDMLEADWIQQELDRLRIVLDKTGGEREFQAFALLEALLVSKIHVSRANPSPSLEQSI